MKRRFQESVLFISVLICLRSVNDSMAVRWRHRSHRTLPVSDISAKNSNSRGHDRKFRIPSPVLPGEDPCRGEDGHPVRCVPDFVNAAFLRKVHTSSVCGTPPSLHCGQPPAPSPGKSVIGNGTGCFLCDSTEPKRSYPAEYLTDLNNPNNLTCWVSALREPQVNISVSLGKKFEMTYISLQFCKSAPRPDSMAILKSVDHGRNWTPLQYFASDCLRFYGKPPGLTASRANEQEAMCSEFPAQLLPNEVARAASYAMPQRVAFVTLDGRPSAQDFERSPALQDLVTATDVRIVLEFRQNGIRVRGGQGQLEGSDYFSLSDLAIGGRCKCNGHGYACVAVEEDLDGDDVSHGIDGGPSMRCKCRHNTHGVDCEKCKPFHHDRPWARATPEDPNECTACNCNQHSRRCRFNMELYKASGEGRSGGVCVKCMHNTYGRNCHLCADGFYRDFARPINHRKACRACACHPIGSMGGICNKTTGQCLCKPGVTGQLCNRCAGDFQQSPSPVTPCVKNSEKVESTKPANKEKAPHLKMNGSLCAMHCKDNWNSSMIGLKRFCLKDYENSEKVESTKPANKEKAPHLKMNGSLCAMHCKDNWNSSMIGLKRFCLKDYVLLQASVLSRNVHNSPSGEWFKYGVDVIDVFNKKQNAISIRPGDHKTVWAAVDDTKVCRCIDLRPRSTYLMMIQPGAAVANGRRRRGGDTRRGLILGRDSIIKQWDDKMSKFMANMECF